jgi:hypothetical protein
LQKARWRCALPHDLPSHVNQLPGRVIEMSREPRQLILMRIKHCIARFFLPRVMLGVGIGVEIQVISSCPRRRSAPTRKSWNEEHHPIHLYTSVFPSQSELYSFIHPSVLSTRLILLVNLTKLRIFCFSPSHSSFDFFCNFFLVFDPPKYASLLSFPFPITGSLAL